MLKVDEQIYMGICIGIIASAIIIPIIFGFIPSIEYAIGGIGNVTIYLIMLKIYEKNRDKKRYIST